MSIFISVAAFNEPLLELTIRDAVSNASDPSQLVFSIIDQHPENRREQIKSILNGAGLRYVNISPIESRGVCWARALSNSHYAGEDYFLQIDSHTLFDKGWDKSLISSLTFIKAFTSDKPIISTYPRAFSINNNEVVRESRVEGIVLVHRPIQGQVLTETKLTLDFVADFVESRLPIKGVHIAGGFIFTTGDFIEQIPYDPHYYFLGEEQNLFLRAWTRGWDVFHVSMPPLYHFYKEGMGDTDTVHWHSKWEDKRDDKFEAFAARSEKRLIDLILGNRDMGIYGLGKERTIEEYATFSGIDYLNRRIIFEHRDRYDFSN